MSIRSDNHDLIKGTHQNFLPKESLKPSDISPLPPKESIGKKLLNFSKNALAKKDGLFLVGLSMITRGKVSDKLAKAGMMKLQGREVVEGYGAYKRKKVVLAAKGLLHAAVCGIGTLLHIKKMEEIGLTNVIATNKKISANKNTRAEKAGMAPEVKAKKIWKEGLQSKIKPQIKETSTVELKEESKVQEKRESKIEEKPNLNANIPITKKSVERWVDSEKDLGIEDSEE